MADGLGLIANIVVIVGAVIAVFEWGAYRCRKRAKRVKLENYLREKKEKNSDPKKKAQYSLTHLVAKLGIPQEQIMDIAFDNENIDLKVKQDAEGFANKLLLTYVGKNHVDI